MAARGYARNNILIHNTVLASSAAGGEGEENREKIFPQRTAVKRHAVERETMVVGGGRARGKWMHQPLP
ncbi:MAG: hypothetical protein ABWW69_03620 [Pyrodictiaceae archaeon]